MSPILAIFRKELQDTIRDRRTLISMIVMPLVLMPLLILGMGWFTDYQTRKSEEKDIKLGVVNAGAAPDLLAFLNRAEKLRTIALEGDAVASVRQGEMDIVLVIPADWAEEVAAHTPVTLNLLFNSTRADSRVTLSRVTSALDSYNRGLVEHRLTEQGIELSLLSTPVALPRDVATVQERGGFFLGFLLPLLLVMWAVMGGMYTAIDATAGEKERKTLEALLATPVRRLEIVIGKLLAVATTSIAGIALALLSLYVAVLQFRTRGIMPSSFPAEAASLRIDPSAVLVMFGAGALLAVMFAALLLTTCIFAKSYREAQSYLTPLSLLVILPVVLVNTIPNMAPAPLLFLIPAVNAVLLFKEVLMGTLNAGHILLTMVSLVFYVLIAVAISAKIFGREGVLFRS